MFVCLISLARRQVRCNIALGVYQLGGPILATCFMLALVSAYSLNIKSQPRTRQRVAPLWASFRTYIMASWSCKHRPTCEPHHCPGLSCVCLSIRQPDWTPQGTCRPTNLSNTYGFVFVCLPTHRNKSLCWPAASGWFAGGPNDGASLLEFHDFGLI